MLVRPGLGDTNDGVTDTLWWFIGKSSYDLPNVLSITDIFNTESGETRQLNTSYSSFPTLLVVELWDFIIKYSCLLHIIIFQVFR